jgi:hypothetical protein
VVTSESAPRTEQGRPRRPGGWLHVLAIGLFGSGLFCGLASLAFAVAAIVQMNGANDPCPSDGTCEAWGTFVGGLFLLFALASSGVTVALIVTARMARSAARRRGLPGR